MAPPRVVETVDVLEQGQLTLAARVPWLTPDQFGLQCFEESLDHGIVIAVALTAHGNLEAMLAQELLVLM